MRITGPRGLKDILPVQVRYWNYIENQARELCRLFSYQEIRTPIFEHTELFLRGIGETTDVVEKEMYTFSDRGGRSVTLRPENTAAVVRAFLEHKLYNEVPPVKLFYIGPMFRYDRPQAGRLRQFHQFGVEVLGSKGPAIDAEIIILAQQYLTSLGLKDLSLYINSVGCPECRPVYRAKLQDYFADKREKMCSDCNSRLERNPMRVLDCKNEACMILSKNAPQIKDCLCDDCNNHFVGLQRLLVAAGLDFVINPRLVRGLDYYTKTAFEFQYPYLGAQSAVCGGGRYDGLVAECGGPQIPGIGFAIGMERVLLVLENQALLPEFNNALDVWIAPLDVNSQSEAFKILCSLRQNDIVADMDYMERSLKAQLKNANKKGVKYALIIGENESAQGKVLIKCMQSGEQKLIDSVNVVGYLKNILEE